MFGSLGLLRDRRDLQQAHTTKTSTKKDAAPSSPSLRRIKIATAPQIKMTTKPGLTTSDDSHLWKK